jgi:DNA replication protein DnaC
MSQAETSVLSELISARYERHSIPIDANQPFGAWDAIFPDPAMTVAAIDRLVHHAISVCIDLQGRGTQMLWLATERCGEVHPLLC